MERKLQEFAEDFARKAGKIMIENFGLGMKKEWKSDSTPITEADREINSLLIAEIKKNFPDHRVLAEEESRLGGDGPYVWVCDPLDGTIPFSAGIPISTFSLALTKGGESILGVIYDPFQDRLYSAAKGKGTYLNGRKTYVSRKSELKQAMGAYEMFDRAKYDTSQLVMFLTNEGAKLVQLCSIVYPSALIAAGEMDFTIFPHTSAHDAAALKIVVEEAGGKVTDVFGKEQRYDRETNGFIASNGFLHEELVALSQKFMKER